MYSYRSPLSILAAFGVFTLFLSTLTAPSPAIATATATVTASARVNSRDYNEGEHEEQNQIPRDDRSIVGINPKDDNAFLTFEFGTFEKQNMAA